MRRSSSRSSQLNRAGGFTLIELLLAITIAAVVIGIVNFAFYQSHRNIEAVTEQREAYQTVRIVLDRMIKDLTCSYIPIRRTQITASELSMYRFVGVSDESNNIYKDSIAFTTTTDIGFSKVPGGVCEVDYYLKEMENRKDVFTLMRREDPTPHFGITKAGSEMEVAEGVLGLNVVYIDDSNQEVNEWDLSKRLCLPKQVKVTITMEANKETGNLTGQETPKEPGKDKLTFSGTASLPLAGVHLLPPQG